MEEKYPNQVSSGYFTGILKAVAVSLIVTFIILFLAALLLCFTDFPEIYTLPSAIAATVLGVLAGSTMAAKNNPCNSLLSSLLTSVIYAVLSYIIGCLLEGRVSFSLNTALFGIIALITGAIASILANRDKRPKDYRSGSPKFMDRMKKRGSPRGYKYKSGKL